MMAADTTNSVGSSCIYGEESGHSTTAARYEIAFDLSWSTFTTVGYGAVSPLSESSGCYAIRLVCALVAFVGVLFGSVRIHYLSLQDHNHEANGEFQLYTSAYSRVLQQSCISS